MGFRNDAYAKVWEIRPHDNYTDIRISISRKNQNGEGYTQDFSGFVRLIGDAHRNAEYLSDGDRIKLISCDVSNQYNKEKNVTYTTFKVFEFENADGSKNAETNDAGFLNVPEGEDAELPFGD